MGWWSMQGNLTDRDGNIRPMVDLRGRFYRIEELDPDFVKTNVDVDRFPLDGLVGGHKALAHGCGAYEP